MTGTDVVFDVTHPAPGSWLGLLDPHGDDSKIPKYAPPVIFVISIDVALASIVMVCQVVGSVPKLQLPIENSSSQAFVLLPEMVTGSQATNAWAVALSHRSFPGADGPPVIWLTDILKSPALAADVAICKL